MRQSQRQRAPHRLRPGGESAFWTRTSLVRLVTHPLHLIEGTTPRRLQAKHSITQGELDAFIRNIAPTEKPGREFHEAAEPQPKKSHHEDTKTRRNPLRFFASSCLRGEQDACAPGFKCLNPPHVRCLPVWSSATTELLSLRGSWRVSVRPKATRRLGFQIGQRTLRVSPLKSCPRSRCIL